MATGLFNWSRTPATNASATYNMAEGMAPSAVNDGIRGIMSDVAQYRDDIAGAIVTGGSSTAYTVTSYSAFTSLALMANQMIAFTPHATNGATVTLNVDSLGAKPLRSAPSTELLAGTLILGTPYVATYSNADAAWYLQNFYGNPYNVPLGAGMDFWLPTAPNSSFVFPIGQAISRTTYATLFALMGTTYGTGDGSTTFTLPDKTGRASVMKEASATRLTSTYFGGNSTALGAVGGSESHALTTAQLAAHTHVNTLTDPGHIHAGGQASSQNAFGGTNSGSQVSWFNSATNTSSATTGITITNASAGSGNAHPIVQPTIVCNYIMRII